MKSPKYYFLFASILLLALTTCKKDPQPIMERFDLSREDLTIGTTSASIVGTYAYSGTIDEITVCVSEDGVHPAEFVADINGKNFAVEMTGLRPATSYQYYYSVDYGFSKPFITETKSFTTLSESPTVRTIDVMSIDSTTVRVNCETVSDGGVEITERGVCWNTYGNPNLDDESLTYTTAGLGQYSCRINGLALGKKYYVKAYAKNASGIGFGEELEFETAAPPGMPVNIELSCDPEEGGNVSGGGIHPVGSQCTVTAVANSGYTFVNWTENGNHVSSEATYTFNVTRECHLVANFTTQTYIITAEVTPDNSGTVTGTGGYNYGEECTLTAAAKPGYEFIKWTKNGTNISTDAIFTFNVNASATYVAHFQTKSYTVNVSAQPSNGGIVSGGGTFNYGQSCTVHATPADGFAFMNWTDGGDVVSNNAVYTIAVSGDKNLVAHFTHNSGGTVPMGAIDGLFTINDSGDQVYFSQGNLQYQASTSTWRFAENQWDFVGGTGWDGSTYGNVSGSNNSNISPTYDGWIDLFGWGTSGWNTGNTYYQPWSSADFDEADNGLLYGPLGNHNLTGDYANADWGVYNPVINGGNQPNFWRTLTKEEWVYVFNERSTGSGIRYVKAMVNDVKGVILLPDGWSTSTYNMCEPNTSDAGFNSNILTAVEWELLEQVGAIFLPVAGTRAGKSTVNCGYMGEYWGEYWSSTSYYGNCAYVVLFGNDRMNPKDHPYRHNGKSVRLVLDYNR